MMNESGKPQRSNAKNCDIKKGKPQLLLNERYEELERPLNFPEAQSRNMKNEGLRK